jgi:hypothetical protein
MMRTSDIAATDRRPSQPGPATQEAEFPETSDIAAVDVIAAGLEARFGSSLPPALQYEIAQQALDRYRGAPVQSFVSILAQRLAIEIATQLLDTS